ncbi:MAG: DUF805 domain-containing protein [Bacteroidia bacterium]|nr:DUF805 domain-containing protein [Bacteroidia bacterium]
MNYYLMAFKRYADFSGRSRRKEYWYFVLFNFLIYILLFAADMAIISNSSSAGLGIFSGIYALATLIPSLAVAVRRLHDIGRSGWSILFGLIPLIGAILLLIWYTTDSQVGSNAYGLNPKDIGEDQLIEQIGGARAY